MARSGDGKRHILRGWPIWFWVGLKYSCNSQYDKYLDKQTYKDSTRPKNTVIEGGHNYFFHGPDTPSQLRSLITMKVDWSYHLETFLICCLMLCGQETGRMLDLKTRLPNASSNLRTREKRNHKLFCCLGAVYCRCILLIKINCSYTF